jgi:capsular exopolysaccharide synthesis family protein
MSKITEALQRAAGKRGERLRRQTENKSTPPPAETPLQSPGEQIAPSPAVKKEKSGPISLREALRHRAEKNFHPSPPATPSLPSSEVRTPPPPAGLDPHLVTYFEPHSPASEQYRLIRTNLQSQNTGNPPHTLEISSSTYGEGKTITAINLAIIIAQDINKPVLLIDCDLRKPQLCQYLSLTPRAGLTDFLTADISLESILLPTKIENLTVLPGTKVVSNPSSLLESERMKHLLTEVKSRFEYVIIDTAPVLSVTDAGVIGSQTDGVLLVIRADRTKKEVIQRAQSALAEAQAKIIGSVLTCIQHPIPDFIYRHL